MSAFDRALAITLKYEGGYSNHPADPGGATMCGVTQATFNAYLEDKGQPQRSVKSISQAELGDIYRARYWDAVRGEQLPPGLDCCAFDLAVNSGVGRAMRLLQRALKLKEDGVFGDVTLAAVQSVVKAGTVDALIRNYCGHRLAFLKALPIFPTFGKGWTSRVNDIQKKALGFWADARKGVPGA